MTKYLAYGSNLDRAQMDQRCPGATVVKTFLLNDWRLVFRGVADIIKAKGFKVPVAIWDITKAHERTLDIYEGVNPKVAKAGMYRKHYLDIGGTRVLVYLMNHKGFARPSSAYYGGIERGYIDLSLPLEKLDEAFCHADEKQKKPGVGRGAARTYKTVRAKRDNNVLSLAQSYAPGVHWPTDPWEH